MHSLQICTVLSHLLLFLQLCCSTNVCLWDNCFHSSVYRILLHALYGNTHASSLLDAVTGANSSWSPILHCGACHMMERMPHCPCSCGPSATAIYFCQLRHPPQSQYSSQTCNFDSSLLSAACLCLTVAYHPPAFILHSSLLL